MKPGKIVLLPFPFADANFRKIRPALVKGILSYRSFRISKNNY